MERRHIRRKDIYGHIKKIDWRYKGGGDIYGERTYTVMGYTQR